MTTRTRWLALAASFALSTALCLWAWAHINDRSGWVLLPAAIYAGGWFVLCLRRARP